jgi:hypothetical protein
MMRVLCLSGVAYLHPADARSVLSIYIYVYNVRSGSIDLFFSLYMYDVYLAHE